MLIERSAWQQGLMNADQPGVKTKHCRSEEQLMFLRSLRFKMYEDLSAMGRGLGMLVTEHPFYAIYTAAETLLAHIGNLINTGAIRPWAEVRTSHDDRPGDATERALRLGVFPTAANPLHWGHLLIGLSAIAHLQLDKVIYIILGHDRHDQELAPVEIRHPMARDVIKDFEPLLAYSAIARDTSLHNEAAFLELLALNSPYQSIDAFYIAGSDYYGALRHNKKYKNIAAALNAQIRAQNESTGAGAIQTAAAVCVDRDGHTGAFHNTHHLPPLPFAASSNMIRQALRGEAAKELLALLPFSAYVDVRAFKLYGHNAQPEQPATLLHNLQAACALEAENSY
jgi:nicotinic acid mononucleotide adenylyltransferase